MDLRKKTPDTIKLTAVRLQLGILLTVEQV